MENFMSEAVVLEAVLVSVLLALWMTWLGLRGLFLLVPATAKPGASQAVRPIRLATDAEQTRQRDAA
jgi:hypothetical protein